MLTTLIACAISLFFYFHTPFCAAWSAIHLGGDQFSCTITALVVILHVLLALIGVVRHFHYF